MEYEIRRIRGDEWQPYRELRLEALKDSPLAFVEQYEEARTRPEQFWRHRVERGASGDTSSMFVAVNDGRLVGKVSCFVEPEFTEYVSAHVVGVYVTPLLRGTGTAERLIKTTVRWARHDARAERVRLFVMEGNDRATAFYRRVGFMPTGATVPYPPDPSYTESEMEYLPMGRPAGRKRRPVRHHSGEYRAPRGR